MKQLGCFKEQIWRRFASETETVNIVTIDDDIAVFSFYANKTICTGEGGMITTDDGSLARRMKTMRLHGIDRDAFDRFQSSAPAWYYEVVAPGYKYNLPDLAAAIGLAQLERAEEFRRERERVASGGG